MTRLFGTDGIRGVANVDLHPKLAYDLGRATAALLAGPGGSILVGQDTRRSGDMLAASVAAGAMSLGVDVHRLGVCPTPALAHLTASGAFRAGSHGLRVAQPGARQRPQGRRRARHEARRRGRGRARERCCCGPTSSPARERRAGLRDRRARLLDEYVADRLAFRRVVHDRRPHRRRLPRTARRAPSRAEILEGTGASVDVRFDEPDGININLDCGATAPQALARDRRRDDADIGFALDGDADRCVAVDEHGEVVDGDQLIGIIALDRLERGALPQGIVVASVLSNGGLEKASRDAGGRLARTPVGDKYILDGMMVMDAGLGGEKSGHVIIRDHANAGDGIVTALEVLGIVARTGKPLSELAAQIPLFPQQQTHDPGSSQGPVGGRSDFCRGRRGGAEVARWGRPDPGPTFGH